MRSYVLDREAVRAVDRMAIEKYGIPGIVLMENAARSLAPHAMRMLAAAEGRTVLIACGRGNNGGDGWALARHLHNGGARPVLAAIGSPSPGSDAEVNCRICRAMDLEEIAIDRLDDQRGAALIVDAIFGTGLDRAVTGESARVIEWINGSGRPVLAVDVPSGLDCDTGRPLGACVRATRTVTFVGAKPGFMELDAQPYVGEVVIGDIGAPKELAERLGVPVPDQPPGGHRRSS
jgi:NAD(P)H-hydrate epimerase